VNRKFVISYLLIFIALISSLSLSRPVSDKIRGGSVALFAPFWEKLLLLKQTILHPFTPTPSNSTLSLEEEYQKLELTNQLLNNELKTLYEWIDQQQSLQSQLSNLASKHPQELENLQNQPKPETQKLLTNLQLQIQAKPARVIFRSLDTWNHSLWINVGEADNPSDRKIIAKNSPVIVGQTIVGVVDYVGTHQSRVRLITVRSVRGGENELFLAEQIESILFQLQRKNSKILSKEESDQISQLLSHLKITLKPHKKTWYLAKGYLQGLKKPNMRGDTFILKGTGFNYDFADEEGSGRDLRTGKPFNQEEEASIPLLRVHDLLITTGMDGVFPAGFKVATISKIHLLKEGDYFYEIEATPLAVDLEGLSLVFVLPPIGYIKTIN
jgi:cell shape-determining protein MreC